MQNIHEEESGMKAWKELGNAGKGKHLGITAIVGGVLIPPTGVALGIAALAFGVKAIDDPGESGSAKPGVVCGLLGLFIGLKMSLLEYLFLFG